ncbi:3-dehydroquinate synthase [candidate division KSB1 bacterium]|jgi:3-dehydroquinate synthase|nr:MAG: 3-dehydroquinate synthase [candidate division KSB1 bacterium]
MQRIDVDLGKQSYPVFVGSGIFDQFNEILRTYYQGDQIAVITNEKIFALHGQTLMAQLPDDVQVITVFVPDGEKAKSFAQLQEVYTRLLEAHFERGSLIIAFGGGVVGDLAGFVAATYLRGVAFAQVPTTLLAQVDSSIGGKTGINHPLGKNLIGAFKQPLFVFSDARFLQTLDDAEIRCGLGEIIKYGFVLNKTLFEYLEKNLDKALHKDDPTLRHLIFNSALEKAKVVMQDEKEAGLRMVLNFGHTFGHALEAEYHFNELKHGEAVILGMKCALNYARLIDLLNIDEFKRGMQLLNRVPIPFDGSALNIEALVKRMALDKKVKQGKVRLILIKHIGEYAFHRVDNTHLLKQAFEILKDK